MNVAKAGVSALCSALFLVGCAAGLTGGQGYHADVYVGESAFLQTRSIRLLSLAYQTDTEGNRWPVGNTLNAGATQSLRAADATGPWVSVELRNDEIWPAYRLSLESAYTEANHRRDQVTQACVAAMLIIDGQTTQIPINFVTSRVLTDRERMPVVTDQPWDPLLELVAKNPPDYIIISTEISLQMQSEQLKQLAAAGQIHYDICGYRGEARAEEILGFRQISEWLSTN